MEKIDVLNIWIQKQQKKDKYELWICPVSGGNTVLLLTLEQLKQLKKDADNRIKKYSIKELKR